MELSNQLEQAPMDASSELIDRLSREQDDVIAQLDQLLARIDQVLTTTLNEIKQESVGWDGQTPIDSGMILIAAVQTETDGVDSFASLRSEPAENYDRVAKAA